MKEHLKDHGLNYFQHMKLAFTYAYKLVFMSVAAIIHAFLPFTLKTYVSDSLNKLYNKQTKDY